MAVVSRSGAHELGSSHIMTYTRGANKVKIVRIDTRDNPLFLFTLFLAESF